MKQRLITAFVAAAIAAVVGVGISIWIKSDQMPGIVLVTSLIGFLFGLVFKFRVLK